DGEDVLGERVDPPQSVGPAQNREDEAAVEALTKEGQGADGVNAESPEDERMHQSGDRILEHLLLAECDGHDAPEALANAVEAILRLAREEQSHAAPGGPGKDAEAGGEDKQERDLASETLSRCHEACLPWRIARRPSEGRAPVTTWGRCR